MYILQIPLKLYDLKSYYDLKMLVFYQTIIGIKDVLLWVLSILGVTYFKTYILTAPRPNFLFWDFCFLFVIILFYIFADDLHIQSLNQCFLPLTVMWAECE